MTKFVIATNEDLGEEKSRVLNAFDKIKDFVDLEYRNIFGLEVWDRDIIVQKELELGIKVNWSDL